MASLLKGIFVFIIAISFGGVAWFVLGMVAGIYGMCSTAPEWFESIYFPLGLLILIGSALFGAYAATTESRLK